MNTVFKFYLQAWTLFAVSGAAALGWMMAGLRSWRARWRRLAWGAAFVMLAASAALFPLVAGYAKTRDRMAAAAPHTLDGMRYMEHASYHDQGRPLALEEDYRGIRWMQDNVQGSPVIVEANTPEYRWG